MTRDELDQFAREYLQAMRRDGDRVVTSPRTMASSAAPALATAQIWTTRPSPHPRRIAALVYVASVTDDGVLGNLVHHELRLAATDDVIIEAGASPTGEPLVLCLWRPLRILPEKLHEYVGTIDPLDDEAIAALSSEELSKAPTLLGHDYVSDVPVLYWEVQDRDTCDDLRYLTGARLLDDDPRQAVRDEYRALTSWLDDEPRPLPDYQVIFDRLLEALPDSDVIIIEEPHGLPPLELGRHPALRTTTPKEHALRAREFTMHCGPVTAYVYITLDDEGLVIDVHARDDESKDLRDMRIQWSETNEQGTRVLWEQTTDDDGLARSPRLTPSPSANHRIEIEFDDVTAAVTF